MEVIVFSETVFGASLKRRSIKGNSIRTESKLKITTRIVKTFASINSFV